MNDHGSRNSPGRRERRKARTRRAILDAALALFGEKGLYATRLGDITEAIDLGKGAFYNYFESKEALVAELLREAVALLEDRCRAAASRLRSLERRVGALAAEHDAFLAEHRAHRLLFHQSRGLLLLDHREDTPLRRVFADYLTRLGDLLPPPGRGRAWTADDRRDLAALLAGTIMGYRSFQIASGLGGSGGAVEAALAAGIPRALERRRRQRRQP